MSYWLLRPWKLAALKHWKEGKAVPEEIENNYPVSEVLQFSRTPEAANLKSRLNRGRMAVAQLTMQIVFHDDTTVITNAFNEAVWRLRYVVCGRSSSWIPTTQVSSEMYRVYPGWRCRRARRSKTSRGTVSALKKRGGF